MSNEQSFFGIGWNFPPVFGNYTSVKMVTEEEDIAQSMQILLSTRPGERVMLPQFGCNLDVLLFEPITTSTIAYVKEMIMTSVLYFESRIEMESININTVEVHDGLILIEMDYTVLSTNSRYNLVYPFYLNKGNNQ